MSRGAWSVCALVLLAVAVSPGATEQCSGAWPSKLGPRMLRFVEKQLYTPEAVVLRGVNLIDPSTSTHSTYPNSSIMYQKGVITGVRLGGDLSAPPGAIEVSLDGYSVMPGLVGMHEHLFYPASIDSALYSIATETAPKLYLSQGVTTARTAGTMHPYADLNIVESINSAQVPGPRIFPTAPYIDSEANPLVQVASLRTRAETEAMAEYWYSQGFMNYKAYMYLRSDMLAGAIDVAHRHGAKVTGHLCAITFSEAVDLGIDCLEHGLLTATDFVPGKEADVCPPTTRTLESIAKLDMEGPEVQSLIDKLVANNVTVTSTLAVFETFVSGRPSATDAALDKVLPESRAQYEQSKQQVDEAGPGVWNAAFAKEMQFEVMFVASGGLLQAGADPTGFGGVVPGYGDSRNVELLAEAGFSELEALKIASTNGAQYLGMSDCIGTLREGALADLLVVAGDPSRNISDVRNVRLVVKDGVAYDPVALASVAKEKVSWV